MELNHYALSPLDGRYAEKLAALGTLCSEAGLIYNRVYVEIAWFITLSETRGIQCLSSLSSHAKEYLHHLLAEFSENDVLRIKQIEQETNHDVKAVEYYLKEKFEAYTELKPLAEYIHFACTSEDINNLAYALMIKKALADVLFPNMKKLFKYIQQSAITYAALPMLSRTHGQPASPTTLGKEFANFAYRLERQIKQLDEIGLLGKFNGAVGNFNAHHLCYPDLDWPAIAEGFVTKLGLIYNPLTTQIEPHDYIAELSHCLQRFNTILIGFCKDMWGYISLNYFEQECIKTEVGSSVMPHKINPIYFENAEGNLGIANNLLSHLADKLPISRWQRDLSDSTVMRNIGSCFGYSVLAWQSCFTGLNRIKPNTTTMSTDLEQHFEIVSEGIQTLMRSYGIENAYEKLKEFTRGQTVSKERLKKFVDSLNLPSELKSKIKALTPENYVGLAKKLVENLCQN